MPLARRLYSLAHDFGEGLHRMLALRPAAARSYFAALAGMRLLPDTPLKQRLLNSIGAVQWPELELPFRSVVVGRGTELSIRPHPGEFDMRSLLDRALSYEQTLFEWLETAVTNYDTIIEIGANVGVYTVFFGKRQRDTPDGPRPRVFAFEASGKAFRRLEQNLAANAVAVHAVHCAVTTHAGTVKLYEPAGHLTNGSLRADFAELFSRDVSVSEVPAVSGREIAALVGNPGRTLLKVDVEGAEADVLRSLRPFIEAHEPDILLEVLPMFVTELEKIDFLPALAYKHYAFASEGLRECRSFDVANGARDLLLRCTHS